MDVAPAVAATLGFVAGLALDEALRLCAPGADVQLKWPNDVVAGNGKLAGILLEAESGPDGLAVVIGIGVNLASAPDGLPFPATSLAARGFIVHPERMFAALTDAWIGFERLWDGGRGMPQIRDLWLSKAAGLGSDGVRDHGRSRGRRHFRDAGRQRAADPARCRQCRDRDRRRRSAFRHGRDAHDPAKDHH